MFEEDDDYMEIGVSTNVNRTFQELLMKSLTEDDNETTDTSNIQQYCLITTTPFQDVELDDIYTLQCGHKFLKYAIFEEVKRQKTLNKKYTFSSKYFSKLRMMEFMCPYCRHVENTLLPIWKKYPIVYQVNYPVHPIITYQPRCKYILTKGTRKGQKCNVKCMDKYACKSHICKYLKHQQQQQQHTEETQHTEATQQLENAMNMVLTDKCQALIKSGKRKGEKCQATMKYVKYGISLCGRHKSYIG